jgi:hypothetical protein
MENGFKYVVGFWRSAESAQNKGTSDHFPSGRTARANTGGIDE